jgi:hypothetical protein
MSFECFGTLRRALDELDNIMKLPNRIFGSPVFKVFLDPLQYAISLGLKFKRSCIIAIEESLGDEV